MCKATTIFWPYDLRVGVMVMWSCGRKYKTMDKFFHNHSQMVKISTMTTAKIPIFHGQNSQPRNTNTKTAILTMTMTEIRISYGQNGIPLI